MRQHITDEISAELKVELLEGLLLGQITDEQAAAERLRRLGLEEAPEMRALVLAPTEAQSGRQSSPETSWTISRRLRAIESVSQLLRDRAPGALVTLRRGEVVVLLPDGAGRDPDAIARLVLQHVNSFYPDWMITIGVGGVAKTPGEIGRSYSQARRAVDVALRFGQRGQSVRFDNLGLYRLLFHVTDRGELRAFVDQVLGPLIEYDRRHKTDFVRTVASFLENNNSLQATSRDLFIHVNTAAYRIQRIQAITGLDLARTDDCLQLKVALMVLEDIEVT
jgi:sugar diacid utilization regulator